MNSDELNQVGPHSNNTYMFLISPAKKKYRSTYLIVVEVVVVVEKRSRLLGVRL